MIKKIILIGITAFSSCIGFAQLTPDVTSWIINTTNAVGYAIFGNTSLCE